jgi:hypothetical protein
MKKLITAVACFLLLACDKEQTTVVYFYGQTGCADVWGYGATDAETKEKLTTYLLNNGIKAQRVTLSQPPAGFISCLACTCPTGRTFAIVINKVDEEKLKALGFYQ